MFSGIFDYRGNKIVEGDTVNIFYVDPMGRIDTESKGTDVKIEFKYGSFGFQTETRFVPLMEMLVPEKKYYVCNHGEKTEYSNRIYGIVVNEKE
mgnify:CR=1 FL=1